MTTLTAHPFADRFPMLSEEELQVLAADIKENGLRHHIVLDVDGRILDGRNRYQACLIAGVEPTTIRMRGITSHDQVSDVAKYEAEVAAYVISANVHRRHMTTGARAAATAMVLGDAGRRKDGKWAYGAARVNGEDSRHSWRKAMEQAGLILDHAPDFLPEVAAGGLALAAALDAATKRRDDARAVEEEKQRMAQEEADAAEWLTTAEPVEGFDRAAYPTAVAAKAAWVGLKMRADQEYENQLATERFLERHLANKAAEAARERRSLVAQMATALGNVADLRDPEERALIAEGLKEFADDIGPREGGFLAPYFLRNIAEWLTVFAGELEGKTNE